MGARAYEFSPPDDMLVSGLRQDEKTGEWEAYLRERGRVAGALRRGRGQTPQAAFEDAEAKLRESQGTRARNDARAAPQPIAGEAPPVAPSTTPDAKREARRARRAARRARATAATTAALQGALGFGDRLDDDTEDGEE